MKPLNFNDGWTVRRLGTSEPPQAVRLPHDAALSERRCTDAAGGKNTGWFEGSDYLYEKRFLVPDEWENRHIALEFEGVYRYAEVYLNGKNAAFHPYGYTGFAVDADAFLEYGKENVVSVIARNADQPNSRWYSGAGLYRPVWLYVLPEQYIEPGGIRIRTLSVDPPRIRVQVVTGVKDSVGGRKIARESNPVRTGKQGEAERESLPKEGLGNGESAELRWQVKLEILDGTNVLAHKNVPVSNCFYEKEGMQTEFVLEHARLWSPNHPRLYTCRVTYGEDVQETVFGIRRNCFPFTPVPGAFAGLPMVDFGWPGIEMTLFGETFKWNILGYDVAHGGLPYFCAYMTAMTLGECINFPIQKNFVFRSKGYLAKQIAWYTAAFLVITCIVNSINCIWVAVAGLFVPDFIYNIGTTVLNGGVSMVIFFVVNKIIFPETVETEMEENK